MALKTIGRFLALTLLTTPCIAVPHIGVGKAPPDMKADVSSFSAEKSMSQLADEGTSLGLGDQAERKPVAILAGREAAHELDDERTFSDSGLAKAYE